MSKKKRNEPVKPEVEKESGYYDLKTQAIQDLVEADESNSPIVPEAELRKYRSGSKIKIAEWVKLLFIKAWFAGAVCFFFIWGLGIYMANMVDTLFITGICFGMVTDLLTNNVLRFFAKTKGANDRYMMFPQKSYWTFPLNILYCYLILACVVGIYTAINVVLSAILRLPSDTIAIGVEPILFGLFSMAVDQLFITIKLKLQSHVRGSVRRTAQ